ncbi:hypothetical protein ABK040_008502 [Willaertia magna]
MKYSLFVVVLLLITLLFTKTLSTTTTAVSATVSATTTINNDKLILNSLSSLTNLNNLNKLKDDDKNNSIIILNNLDIKTFTINGLNSTIFKINCPIDYYLYISILTTSGSTELYIGNNYIPNKEKKEEDPIVKSGMIYIHVEKDDVDVVTTTDKSHIPIDNTQKSVNADDNIDIYLTVYGIEENIENIFTLHIYYTNLSPQMVIVIVICVCLGIGCILITMITISIGLCICIYKRRKNKNKLDKFDDEEYANMEEEL